MVARGDAQAPEGTVDYRALVPQQPAEAKTEPTYRDDFATWLSSSRITSNNRNGLPKTSKNSAS